MSVKRIGKGFDFPKKSRELDGLKKKLPKIIANNSLNWFLKGFRQGGGQTDSGQWAERKKKSKKKARRGILVQSGALRRDVQIRMTSFSKIIIGTARIAYARRHNEGLDMPKREFLGDSKKMNKSNKKLILRSLNKILK